MRLPSFMTGRQAANSEMWFFLPHESESEATARHHKDRTTDGMKASALFCLVETVSTGVLNYEMIQKWERGQQ